MAADVGGDDAVIADAVRITPVVIRVADGRRAGDGGGIFNDGYPLHVRAGGGIENPTIALDAASPELANHGSATNLNDWEPNYGGF